jgi:2-aminoadipate transaminase
VSRRVLIVSVGYVGSVLYGQVYEAEFTADRVASHADASTSNVRSAERYSMLVPRTVAPLGLISSHIHTAASTLDTMSECERTIPSTSKTRNHAVRYDLYRGHPNMKLLPASEMKQIMSDFLREDEPNSWTKYLNYGADEGDDRFRLALRSFLDRRTADDDRGDSPNRVASAPNNRGGFDRDLFITDGVSHGLELICATCTRPGDEVWVERPTYFLAPKIFESNDLIVKSLPMMSDRLDERGDIGRIDIGRLEQMVEKLGVAPPKVIYVIPSYQNPTGRSMTVEERERLASFALRNGVILVADEVYHLLDWDHRDEEKSNSYTSHAVTPRRPAGIAYFDATGPRDQADLAKSREGRIGCCVSVSSFTKIFCPGIRLGWIDAPSLIIQRLKSYGYICSQGGNAPFVGRMMTHAIESNLLDAYLDKLKHEYAERYELMCNILKDEPRIAVLTRRCPGKRGGYFIWIEFPSVVNSAEFLTYSMLNYGVKFMAGGRCDPFTEADPCGSHIRSCARLCFADLDREELAPATSAFVESFRTFMNLNSI